MLKNRESTGVKHKAHKKRHTVKGALKKNLKASFEI